MVTFPVLPIDSGSSFGKCSPHHRRGGSSTAASRDAWQRARIREYEEKAKAKYSAHDAKIIFAQDDEDENENFKRAAKEKERLYKLRMKQDL
ncbi:hypothetical protein STCU_11678 [Strigomonas culicis]|nr:hypothetical protein STCU_11678 [Strigomonas culicis]|eukprot:EPY15913.1 hypothetical protein STCU_11678 [Strigomonas culicis]